MGRFEGLTVLVTGATGGFGRRAVRAARRRGRAPGAVRHRCRPGCERCAASLPTESAVLAGDICAGSAFGRARRARGRSASAASTSPSTMPASRRASCSLPQVPSDEARRIIDIDLMGVFYAMKHQLPQMERQYRQTRQGRRHRQHRLGRRPGRRAASVGLRRRQAWRRRPDALGGSRICDQGHPRQRRLPGLRAHAAWSTISSR